MKQGWTYKKLGEVCAHKNKILRANKYYAPNDQIYYIDISSIDNSQNIIISTTPYIFSDAPSRAQQIVEKGDILISLVRPNLKNIAIVTSNNKQLVASSGFCVLRSEADTNNRYVFYIVRGENFTKHLLGRVQGANYPAVREEDIKNYIIPIPPLAEQERIVAELDLLSSIIDKKKAQLKELDQLAQSIFYTMFGDPITNEKGWQVKTIGDTCNITCGQDYKTVKDDNGLYPIYGTGGIMGWASQYRCPKHSVIIGRKGNINNPILVDVDFWNVDTAFGITPKNEELKVIYFFFFCKEYDFTKHDVSVTIPSLRRTDILKIKLPLPPLSLQQEFAEKVEAIERQKALVQQSIAETQTLFDSRMDHWFS